MDRPTDVAGAPAPRLSPDHEFLLAHCATQYRVPVPWFELAPAVHAGIDTVLLRYAEDERKSGDGPLPPMPDGTDFDAFRQRLHDAVDQFSGPPFTMQRLAELLLQSQKQYSRLPKVASALERTLTVVSTADLTPEAAAGVRAEGRLGPVSLKGVNESHPGHLKASKENDKSIGPDHRDSQEGEPNAGNLAVALSIEVMSEHRSDSTARLSIAGLGN